MRLFVSVCTLLSAAVFCVGTNAAEDAILPTAAQLLEKAMGNRELQTTTGEQFAWHAAYNSYSFLAASEATGSTDPSYPMSTVIRTNCVRRYTDLVRHAIIRRRPICWQPFSRRQQVNRCMRVRRLHGHEHAGVVAQSCSELHLSATRLEAAL